MPLPDDTLIWPGHDYGGLASSTLGEEKTQQSLPHRFFLIPWRYLQKWFFVIKNQIMDRNLMKGYDESLRSE
jgi:hypothetical protein